MKKISFSYIKQLPAQEKRITFSTVLTLLRICMTPVIVYAMIMHQWGMAFGLFILAAFTDLLDGYIARICNDQTFLGACLDPIADKFLLLSCFFTLAFVQTPLFTIPLWFVTIVLVKELLLICGAAVLVLVYEQCIIMPSLLGKITMVVQIMFIIWLFSCYFFHWMPIKTYCTMLSLLLLLTGASLVDYTMRVFRVCIRSAG